MKILSFLQNLDDRVNPIVVKELRQAMQSRLVVTMLILCLGLVLLILGVKMGSNELKTARGEQAQVGLDAFEIVNGFMLATCMLLLPGLTSLRLSSERSDSNTDLMFSSSLTPRQIIFGKMVSSMILSLLIFSACTPFMAFAYILRGIDIPTVLVALSIDFAIITLSTQFAVFLASLPLNRAFKFMIGLFGAIILLFTFGNMIAVIDRMVRYSSLGNMPSDEFWGIYFSIAAGIALLIGLFFVWSVSLISPSSSNRNLTVRIYLFVSWILSGLIIGAWAYTFKEPQFMVPWAVIVTTILGFHILIFINDRDSWNHRIAKTIPTSVPLRVIAFLFYTGSAGGVIFCVSLIAISFGVWALALNFTSTAMINNDMWETLNAYLVILFYGLAYSFLGIAFRRNFIADKVPASFNWVIGAVFLGIGTLGPLLLAFLFVKDAFRYSNSAGASWWVLANPFAAASDMVDYRRNTSIFEYGYFYASSTMLVIGFVLCFYWFTEQWKNFRSTKAKVDKRYQPIELQFANPA
jgi:ABC-type transport system involved in multi-copper enzyme maturation permease subunit